MLLAASEIEGSGDELLLCDLVRPCGSCSLCRNLHSSEISGLFQSVVPRPLFGGYACAPKKGKGEELL